MSWPIADCAPCETMNSSAVQPCARERVLDRELHALRRQRSPSTASEPFDGSARRKRSRAASIPASAARCARRMPASSVSFLTRRRSVEELADPASARRRSRAGGRRAASGNVCGTRRARDADAAGRRAASSSSEISQYFLPESSSSSRPSANGEISSASTPASWMRGHSKSVMTMCLRPSFSRVEERVAERQRHLVPELGVANGVAVDEDVGHAGSTLTARSARALSQEWAE